MSEPIQPERESSTAGWDAITAAAELIYPNQEPRHFGTVLKFALGGRDPLDGTSIYLHEDGLDEKHWHYISYGMSELYEKESENKQFSGWGFEFTFRLKWDANEFEPPRWPLSLLQNLARYVFKSGNVFGPGHHLPLNGPIALGVQTRIHAAMFVEDPELKTIDTPHGKLQFLQLVGITMDELDAGRSWNTKSFLKVMAQTRPLLVTDLHRDSILACPAIAALIQDGIERDGSSTAWQSVGELSVKEYMDTASRPAISITLGASAVANVQSLLRSRLAFGRSCRVVGPTHTIVFAPADAFSWKADSAAGQMTVNLSTADAHALAAALKPIRGDYSVEGIPQINLQITPSNIMDSDGKTVVQVIG